MTTIMKYRNRTADARWALRITRMPALLMLFLAGTVAAQVPDTHMMRPVIRGRHAAVSSMRAQATEAARRILDTGGNAFDAAVAGQAVLGITDFADNGIGSDAVALVYVSGEKKVYSINA